MRAKQDRQITTKMECCFDSFAIYIFKKNLHYLDMNENFCGVTFNVLLCVLTKLVFLPSQNITVL